MTDTSTYTDLEETPVSADDDDLEALQRAATSLGIDPTEPGAEEWLRGTPDYRLVRFGIASRCWGEAIMDTFRPLIDALAALAAKDEETR